MEIKRSDKITGVILISIASMLWGLDGVVLTPRLSNLDIVFVVFILHALPFLIMNIFLYNRYKELRLLDKTAALSLLAVSVFGGVLGTIAIVKALFLVHFQKLSIIVLLQKLQPVFAIILAAIVLKEKLTKRFLFWGSIAIIAGYFLTFRFNLPDLHNDKNILQAALYSVFAAFSFGSSTVFSKNILKKVDFISATFFRYGLSTLLLLPFVFSNGIRDYLNSMTTSNWIIIVIISLTTGSGAIFLYYKGLKYVKASTSTISELFFPITAIILDYLINGNVLSPVQWISAAIMIFAIIKAGMSSNNPKEI